MDISVSGGFLLYIVFSQIKPTKLMWMSLIK